MRKTIYFFLKGLGLIILMSYTNLLPAQNILFQEDFDGVGGPTLGGAGTYSFPVGWLKFNVDNKTPAGGVSYINEAWERREDFNFNTSDSAAFSTSWYNPVGVADDWMFTPAIGPLPANCTLKWNAVTYDPAYPDGYEVRIMTTTPTVGNLLTSTVLLTLPAENTIWTPRQVSLSSYVGATVYIAFRNNSNNQFLLLIDDVTVDYPTNFDAKLITSGKLSEYTLIPNQQILPVVLKDTIQNMGVQNLTNVRLKVNVYDAANTQVFTATSPFIPTMTPGSKQLFTAGTWTPSQAGYYTVKYFPLLNEVDQVPANDTLYDNINISDTTYARDDATVVGGLGIGAGVGGFLGQKFTINTPTDLTSVSFYVTKGYLNEKAGCAIWNMTAGVPNLIIATTDTILYPDDSARLYTVPIAGGSFSLAPGDYLVSAIEFDSTVQLGTTLSIFTPGTVWVSWPGQVWKNVEEFGSSFVRTFVIRPNLYKCPVISGNETIVHATCSTCTDGSISITPSGGNAPYTYLWNTSATTNSIGGVVPGVYSVTITDAFNCQVVYDYTVLNTFGITENTFPEIEVLPNPNNGLFTILSDVNYQTGMHVEIFNINGEKVYSNQFAPLTHIHESIDLSSSGSGLYLIRFISGDKSMTRTIIIE